MNPFATLTPSIACEALTSVGVEVSGAELRLERRDECWIAVLPGDRLAWFAASAEGRRRLELERRVLGLIHARCSFGAPRLLIDAGDFDVRAMVPGRCDPWGLAAEVLRDASLARRLGAELGDILAEQHERIAAEEVVGWLPRTPAWPRCREWVLERVAHVVTGADLRAQVDAVLRAYEAVEVGDEDRALVHTDVGFHNLAIDPESRAVRGLFYYEGAAYADRHHDFRYLIFDVGSDALLEAAVAAYKSATGRDIHRARVELYNAACAVTFLAYRMGTPAEERSCGRTLAEDLRWSRTAIERALARI